MASSTRSSRNAPLFAVLSLVIILALSAATAGAASCRDDDGTLNGATPSLYTVATPVATFYVDDRDFLDLDDDDDAGGIWVYWETNEIDGLQAGGSSVAEPLAHAVDDLVPPRIDPIPVGPFTLFPNGIGGGCSSCEPIHLDSHDTCMTHATPDTLIF